MIRDNRPFFVKNAYLKFQNFYAAHFLRPQMTRLGQGCTFMKPWHVKIFGAPIVVGNYVTIIAAPDNKVRLAIWSESENEGKITIGDYSMICPGVRLSSAVEISVGDNCMIASRVYITDCDWHDVYDRIAIGKSAAVRIDNNVWIGDSAIVCKGVHIGENSIIGAGSVVVDSIPANVIAAGNPARKVKALDPDQTFTTRANWFQDPDGLFSEMSRFDRAVLGQNSLWHWLRCMFFPEKGD